MKIGVTIPNHFGIEEPDQVLAFGPLAENLGFDSVWVMDHLLHAGFVAERLGDKPYYHALATLSHLSAMTKRVSLGTSILVLPYHNPIEMAKYVATLDQFSHGRVILGIGAGELVEEFEALGVDKRKRGALTNEGLALMREFWEAEEPRVRSEHWQIAGMKFTPKPARSGGLPVWVGGASAGAMKRVARFGDGWHPGSYDVSPADYERARSRIEYETIEAGRDPNKLQWTVRIEVADDGHPWVEGIDTDAPYPDKMIAAIDAYAAVGVTHTVIALGFGDVSVLTDMMKTISHSVLPQVRR